MPTRWQTRDRLFDVKPKKNPNRGDAEMPLTPRPGERLRWCAHDRRLVYELQKPDASEALSGDARAAIASLVGRPWVTFEQIAWLRRIAKRVSFKQANERKSRRARRAMKLGGEIEGER